MANSSIKSRIEKLRQHTSIDKEKPPWLVVVYGETGKPDEALREKAKAEYKKDHPDWPGKPFNVMWVKDDETKELMQQLLAGVPREKLS